MGTDARALHLFETGQLDLNMRRQWLIDSGLIVLVVGLGLLIATHAPRQTIWAASQNGNPTPPAVPKDPVTYPEMPVQRITGTPAMHPTHPDQTPAFSADELRQFLMTTPGAFGATKTSGVKITRIDCNMKGGDVGGILQRVDTGLSNDMSVCYVEYSGTFTYYGLPSQRAARGVTLMFNTGFLVFDARTGNLVLTGGLEHPSTSQ